MRIALFVACLLITACSSRERGGTVSREPLKPCALVVVPIGDALRHRVRVIGTGAPVTAGVIAELRRRGFAPALAPSLDEAAIRSAAADAKATLVLAGTFVEWEPDLMVDLQVCDLESGRLVAEAERVIGSVDRRTDAARADEVAALARGAVDLLVNPPPVSDGTGWSH